MAHDSTFVAALTEQAKALISPVGQIADFHTVPNGWLRCDGSTYNISEYPALFAAVGTKYGGDGKTTFAVPNLHRKFREGTTTDSEVGTSVSAGLPNISGSVSVAGAEEDLSRTSGTLSSRGALSAYSRGKSAWTGYEKIDGCYWSGLELSASESDSTYGNSSTVQPASGRFIPCIKC